MGFKAGAAKLMQKTRGHLAQGAVLFGYEEDFLFQAQNNSASGEQNGL